MLTRMMMLVLQKRPRGNQTRAADFLRSRAFDMQMDVCHELFLTDIYTWHAAYKAHTQLARHVFGEAPHSTCIYLGLPRPHLERLLSKAYLSISRPSEVWSMDFRRWIWSRLLPFQVCGPGSWVGAVDPWKERSILYFTWMFFQKFLYVMWLYRCFFKIVRAGLARWLYGIFSHDFPSSKPWCKTAIGVPEFCWLPDALDSASWILIGVSR